MPLSAVPREAPAPDSFLAAPDGEGGGGGEEADVPAAVFQPSARVRSSGYGGVAPWAPAVAKKRPGAAVEGRPRPRLAALAPYTAAGEGEGWAADAAFWAPAPEGGCRTLDGAVQALRLSASGACLAVQTSAGLLSGEVDAWEDGGLSCRGELTGHEFGGGGARGAPLPPSLSHCMYAGLSERLMQAGGGGAKARAAPTAGLASRGASSKPAAKAVKGGVDTGKPVPLVMGSGTAADGAPAVAIWAAGCRSLPLLTLTGESLGVPLGSGPASAAFFYLDRFALVGCGSRITAARFSLGRDVTASEAEGGAAPRGGGAAGSDTARLRRRFAGDARAWSATSWDVGGSGDKATAVSVVAAHNSFRSPLIFAACGDRSVRVYDVGQGGAPVEVLRVPDVHSRTIHTLTLPDSSSYADGTAGGLDCFLTASTDALPGGGPGASNGLVRLWDIRSSTCARQLTGHVNNKHVLGAALSPDLLMVAVGSEDRAVVVYDLRTGGVLAKLRGAKDVVTSVAWSPRTEHLLAGSLDGGVRAYTAAEAAGVAAPGR